MIFLNEIITDFFAQRHLVFTIVSLSTQCQRCSRSWEIFMFTSKMARDWTASQRKCLGVSSPWLHHLFILLWPCVLFCFYCSCPLDPVLPNCSLSLQSGKLEHDRKWYHQLSYSILRHFKRGVIPLIVCKELKVGM